MKFAPLMRAALLVSAVAALPVATSGLAAVDSRVNPEFSKLFTIYELVKANYVDQVDDDKLIKGAIDGMLASLDPHSNYLDGPSLQRLETMIDGNYTGLGLSVVEDDGAVKIVSPFKGSPAEKAGLKAGDYIVYCSSFFGDELWPADQLGFVRSAIQACPNQVDFVVVRDPKLSLIHI